MNYDNLHMLGAVADMNRKKLVGDTVTFAASYYMNYTNMSVQQVVKCVRFTEKEMKMMRIL